MPKDNKHSRLLDACKTVVAEKGVRGATVVEVARTAGITPGLVHYYFPSKQALVLALFERLAEGFATRLQGAGLPTVQQFVEAALALGEGADPEGVRAWVWLSAEALHDPELNDRWHATATQWIDLVAGALERQGVAEPREVAGTVVSTVLGAWQLGTAAPGALPRGSAAGGLLRLVDSLLPASEAP